MAAPSRQPLRVMYRVGQGLLVVLGGLYAVIVILVFWSSLTPWGIDSMDAFWETTETTQPTTTTEPPPARPTTTTTEPPLATTTAQTTPKPPRVVGPKPTPTTTPTLPLVFTNLLPQVTPQSQRQWQPNQYGCHSDGRCLDEYDNWCDEGELVYLEEIGEDVCPDTADDW